MLTRKFPRRLRLTRALPGLLLLGSSLARADVKLPALFGDHMVLQQAATVPVWGWADPGEKVSVAFGGKKAEATPGADGKWRADLPALPDGTPPGTLVIAGKNTITLNDVLVGDVWVCGGQSNMAFGASRTQVAEATDSQIRLFLVPQTLALAPREDVHGSWKVCSPQSAGGFTAVGLAFGQNLRTALKRPIGLIESCVGGTGAQEWTPLAALQANPALSHYAAAFAKIAATYPGGDAEYIAKSEAYVAAAKDWKDDPEYQTALKAWTAASAQAKAAGQPIPAAPKPKTPAPSSPLGRRGDPVLLYNGMIAPLIPYAIKGAIWYQGENNAQNAGMAIEYRTLFPAMIQGWRGLWKEGDFPFLFVQLANFNRAGDGWPMLRESQLKTLALPKTGMAVTIDIGTGGNIHPPDKADVGARLALAARHVAYGENLAYTGPIYEAMKPVATAISLSFKTDSLGGGLAIGTAPWVDPLAAPVSKTELEGFVIAGEDKNWLAAQARIVANTVVVSSAQVPKPVAVRYAWAANPPCNLYNKAGLPASPFRTDEWPPETVAPTAPHPQEPNATP